MLRLARSIVNKSPRGNSLRTVRSPLKVGIKPMKNGLKVDRMRLAVPKFNNPPSYAISTFQSRYLHTSLRTYEQNKDIKPVTQGELSLMNKALEQAKEFGNAMWVGSKELYANFWISQDLQKRQKASEVLSRKDLRFIRQHKSDLWPSKPSVLGFQFGRFLKRSLLILGLYLAAVPGALPSTLRISLFQKKSKVAATTARKESSEAVLNYLKQLLLHSTPSATNDPQVVVSKEIKETFSKILGLVEKQEYVDPEVLIPLNKTFETLLDVVEMERTILQPSARLLALSAFFFLPNPVLIASINKHFGYLASDDQMVLSLPNGLNDLTDQELHEFCSERGLLDLKLNRNQMIHVGEDWLLLSRDPTLVPATFILFAAANSAANVAAKTPIN